MPVTHFIKEPKSVDVDDLPESTIKDYLQDRYDLTPTIHETGVDGQDESLGVAPATWRSIEGIYRDKLRSELKSVGTTLDNIDLSKSEHLTAFDTTATATMDAARQVGVTHPVAKTGNQLPSETMTRATIQAALEAALRAKQDAFWARQAEQSLVEKNDEITQTEMDELRKEIESLGASPNEPILTSASLDTISDVSWQHFRYVRGSILKSMLADETIESIAQELRTYEGMRASIIASFYALHSSVQVGPSGWKGAGVDTTSIPTMIKGKLKELQSALDGEGHPDESVDDQGSPGSKATGFLGKLFGV